MGETIEDPGFVFLQRHHGDIRALVIALGVQICRARGWDVEDLVSEVQLALHRKQGTGSRFDPSKSSLSNYIIRVLKNHVGHRLAAERTLSRDPERAGRMPVPQLDELLDERGLDDDQHALLAAVLDDARQVLRREDDIAYRTLVQWLLAEREVADLGQLSGVPERYLLRYVAKLLSRLEREADPKWRPTWHKHRMHVVRRLKSEVVVEEAKDHSPTH
ncbi:MAG: hypothetical protein U1F43_26285 [Myxococcota bacterium]